MGPKAKKVCENTNNKKIDYEKLTLQDVICPVCLSIMIEPVRMPCNHLLCMPCFKDNVDQTALHCPMCRTR